jgi:gentisate 1,2-dioxygenase
MAVQMTRSVEELEAYCARLRAAGLDAPWSRPGPLIPPKPTATQARHWRWRDIEPLLFESSEYLSPHRGAERRVLRLHNPGVPERTVAHSLVLAVQYLLPGEVAPAHRHSPTAIRFMLHGEGAFTTVDGQKCAMKPGDLVVTPGMAWHDHGNEGGKPIYWMDILDWQIVR